MSGWGSGAAGWGRWVVFGACGGVWGRVGLVRCRGGVVVGVGWGALGLSGARALVVGVRRVGGGCGFVVGRW